MAVRSGLDAALSDDGDGGLVGLEKSGWGKALGFYGIQLVLNAAWTPIFFGAQQPGWALVDIIAMWLAIGLTMMAFFRVRKAAGWLMVPYLVWVSFAMVLNFTLWRMN